MFGTQRRPPTGRKHRGKIVAGIVGTLLAGSAGFAASNWFVGVNAGSSGESKSTTINNLTITAIAFPATGSQLYPGASGDVVVKVSNPNAFPVTITDVQLPANTTYAAGYTDSALSAANAGCTATSSGVSWAFATAAAGSSHALASPLTVAPGGNLSVTLTGAAVMSASAPAACAGTYFSMPPLAGVTAYADTASATVSPATDAWTS